MNQILEKSHIFGKYCKGSTFPEEYVKCHVKVREAIEKMESTEKVKVVMRLYYLDGLTFTEISKRMDITYQWVYRLHKIGVEKISKILR